jgi:hypothetical protein
MDPAGRTSSQVDPALLRRDLILTTATTDIFDLVSSTATVATDIFDPAPSTAATDIFDPAPSAIAIDFSIPSLKNGGSRRLEEPMLLYDASGFRCHHPLPCARAHIHAVATHR